MERLQRFRIVERLTPERMLTSMLLVWLVLYFALPLHGQWLPDIEPYVIIGLCLLGLYAGFALCNRQTLRLDPLYSNDKIIQFIFLCCLALGLLGIGMRCIDWFVFRNVAVSNGISENRQALLGQSGGLVAVMAALLTPYNQASTLFALIAGPLKIKLPLKYLSYAGTAFWVPANLLIGSRSAMFFFLLPIVFGVLLVLPTIEPKHKRRMLYGALVGFLVYSAVFIWRNSQFGATIQDIAVYSSFTKRVPMDQDFMRLLARASTSLAAILFSVSSAAQYILHGFFEALHVIAVKKDNFQFGQYEFAIVPKFLNAILGTPYNQDAIDKSGVAVGVFSTFFGPAFTDFAEGAPAFCYILGCIASQLRSVLRAGNILAMPFYCVLLLQIAVMPVGNALCGAGGLETDISLGLLWMLSSVVVRTMRRGGRSMSMSAPAVG